MNLTCQASLSHTLNVKPWRDSEDAHIPCTMVYMVLWKMVVEEVTLEGSYV